MTTLTEGQHKGEFIVQAVDADRGDYAFDQVTFASAGSAIVDGQVVKDNGSGKAVTIAGTVDTAGDSNEDIIGIAFGAYDVTSGDVEGAIVARGCVVDVNLLTIPGSNDTAVIAALKLLGIVAR